MVARTRLELHDVSCPGCGSAAGITFERWSEEFDAHVKAHCHCGFSVHETFAARKILRANSESPDVPLEFVGVGTRERNGGRDRRELVFSPRRFLDMVTD